MHLFEVSQIKMVYVPHLTDKDTTSQQFVKETWETFQFSGMGVKKMYSGKEMLLIQMEKYQSVHIYTYRQL